MRFCFVTLLKQIERRGKKTRRDKLEPAELVGCEKKRLSEKKNGRVAKEKSEKKGKISFLFQKKNIDV